MEKLVTVTQTIKVTIDESKFDDNFMNEFREVFYDFNTLDEHFGHLAQMYARGLCDNDGFIEGYGETDEMGINFRNVDIEVEVEQ